MGKGQTVVAMVLAKVEMGTSRRRTKESGEVTGIVELVLEGVDDVAWITGIDGHRRTCSRRCRRCSSVTT